MKEYTPGQLEYHEYLKSSHWSDLKHRKQDELPKICASCTTHKHVQLHHMHYRSSFYLTVLEDMCWLCKTCHMIFHSKIKGAFRKSGTYAYLLQKTLDVINSTDKKKSRNQLKRERRQRRKDKNRERQLLRMERRELSENTLTKKQKMALLQPKETEAIESDIERGYRNWLALNPEEAKKLQLKAFYHKDRVKRKAKKINGCSVAFNHIIGHTGIKQRAALKSTMAGKVVVVRKEA